MKPKRVGRPPSSIEEKAVPILITLKPAIIGMLDILTSASADTRSGFIARLIAEETTRTSRKAARRGK